MAFALRATDKVCSVNDEEDLRRKGYTLGATLGEGSYAKVKCAYSEKFNRKVALKIINCRKAPKDFQQKFLPRELEVLRTISHPNIIQLLDVMRFGQKVYLVLEMAGHGDLLEYIKLRGALPDEKAKLFFIQLAEAVEYLHHNHVVHRDLKCENILLDVHNNVKLTDFGFCRFYEVGNLSKTFCGSAAYAAPEILQGIPYNCPEYDVWSTGVILYIMVCGSMPYDDSNVKRMIRYQTERKVGFSSRKTLSNDVKILIHGMLEADVNRRLTMSQALESPWLYGVANPLTVALSSQVPLTTTQQMQEAAQRSDSSSLVRRTMEQTPSYRTSDAQPRLDTRDTSRNNTRDGDSSQTPVPAPRRRPDSEIDNNMSSSSQTQE